MLFLKDGLSKTELNVACILDEFSYQCFRYECNLITFRPDNWQEILTKEKPIMLFVESAWKGNEGAWQYKIGKYGSQDKDELVQLIDWCRKRNIPCVFWNKEDPVHFEKFIDSAKLFDFIFTTDGDCVDKYRKILGHNNVYVLPFAAQPRIHNPIKDVNEKKVKLCFTGSYYATRHEGRKKDLEDLLDVAMSYGLDIYDRNYDKNGEANTQSFMYPERFQPYIQGSLKYDEITKAYKGYTIMLNVNSVKDSPTMFSRRVFEILACGTPIVSTYSRGIENTFGKELVQMGKTKEEYRKLIIRLMTDLHFYERICIQGVREILNNHTYSHRLSSIVKNIGIKALDNNHPKVSVICIAEGRRQLELVLESYTRQNYSNKELIIISSQERIIRKIQNYFSLREELLNRHTIKIKEINDDVYSLCEGEYISWFSFDNYYGANYLTDLVNGTKYSSCPIIGKASFFIYNKDSEKIEVSNTENEFAYVSKVKIAACIIETKLFQMAQLGSVFRNLEDMEVGLNENNSVQTILSIDKYNFIEGLYLHSPDIKTEEDLIDKVDI